MTAAGWTVTLPTWAWAAFGSVVVFTLAIVVGSAVSSGKADRLAENYERQRVIRDQAARDHAERNRD